MSRIIYSLVDPQTDTCMFIGYTKDSYKLESEILSVQYGRDAKSAWLNDLRQSRQRPKLVVLDHISADDSKGSGKITGRLAEHVARAQRKGEAQFNKRRGRAKESSAYAKAKFYIKVLRGHLDHNHILYPLPHEVRMPGSDEYCGEIDA